MSTTELSYCADLEYSYPAYAQPLSNPHQATSALTGTKVKLENAPSVRARQPPRLTIESPSCSPNGGTASKETSVDQAGRVLTPDSDHEGSVCTAAVAVTAPRNDTDSSPTKGAN